MDFDVLVIGSGFGGSVTALRLTEKGYRVGVLEAGARFEDDDFAETRRSTSRSTSAGPRSGCYGIQRIDALRDSLIVAGAGVGGGSLVYANTLYEPLPRVLQRPAVEPHHRLEGRARAVLRPGQADARRRREPAAHAVRRRDGEGRRRHGRGRHLPPDAGRRLLRRPRPGRRASRSPTRSSAAPARTATPASNCGECMTGCRHNAKNTLVKNYLYLAEQNGATVLPLTTVTRVTPRADGRRTTSASGSRRPSAGAPRPRGCSPPSRSSWRPPRSAPRGCCTG